MRIAFVSAVYGGLDSYVREMALYLAEKGWSIHVIYLGSVPQQWFMESQNIELTNIIPGPFHYYVHRLGLTLWQIPARVKQYETSLALSKALHKIHKIHGLDLVELSEGLAFPHLFREVPFVLKMHGSNWTINHYCEDGPYHNWQIDNQRRMLLTARQVHALSRSLADFISGACNVPRRLIKVTPYPIDTAKFRPMVPPSQVQPFRLMTVGRLERRKGIHTLVEAMKQVWLQEPDTHLHLYGSDGDFGRAQIEEIVPEHNGRIHFEGFVARETLIERYHQTHVYVSPTRYETFGYTLLEALACGRPVIASDIGPVSDLVRHEETGWLVERDNVEQLSKTILHALQHPLEREQYGIAGRMVAEKYSYDRIMPRQVELYERAISS